MVPCAIEETRINSNSGLMQWHFCFRGKNILIRSVALSLEDIRRIFERLLEYVSEQGDREIEALVKPEDQDEAEFEQYKTTVRAEAFRVTVTISGPNGELYGDDADLFDSPNLPEPISKIYMTNRTAYLGVANVSPANSFELLLDFSKPLLLDSSHVSGDPTPNVSHLNIMANRDAWIASISDAVTGILDNRKNKRIWLHRAYVYDIGLVLLGLPAGLYGGWKCSTLVEKYVGSVSPFLSALTYVYIVLAIIWVYRIFFGYTKWAFPTVELKTTDNPPKKHRTFWYLIAMALLGQLIFEIFF